MRSTIHAVCCGTKRMMVLVGRRLRDEKYDGGPCCCELPPKMLVGFAEAVCELSWEKAARANDDAKAAARGVDRELASGREFRSRPTLVEAMGRMRDAIMCEWVAGAMTAPVQKFHLRRRVGAFCTAR
jgi:hypothetical protein